MDLRPARPAEPTGPAVTPGLDWLRIPGPLHQLGHEILVEALQRPGSLVQDSDPPPRPGRHVAELKAELKGDVPASDKDDPSGQFRQVQKLIAAGLMVTPEVRGWLWPGGV